MQLTAELVRDPITVSSWGECTEGQLVADGVTLEPVCGCDGTSYTSAACADERGVRVASEGECADGG